MIFNAHHNVKARALWATACSLYSRVLVMFKKMAYCLLVGLTPRIRPLASTHSPEADRDRRRRKHLAEGSFADAANNYHFKRSRWRRLWRQQIQDFLIGAIQNVKILMRHVERRLKTSVGRIMDQTHELVDVIASLFTSTIGFIIHFSGNCPEKVDSIWITRVRI